MIPNLPNEIQKIGINQPNLNQINPNQNISSIQKISITKIEGQKHTGDSNLNHINNINSTNSPIIIKETKIVSQTFNNSKDPQRFSFSDNSNLDMDKFNLENQKNNGYKLLIKKIASQLKKPIKTPTQGFFNFALQKGEYSLIIIRRISTQMRNHQIEFNNEVFRIYTQKYKKYRELIKRIAHLLKISMKNQKYFENFIHDQNTNSQNIGNNIEQTTTIKNINNNNNINIKQNYNEKQSSIKSEQMKINNNNNVFNQKKIKTQSIAQTNINKTRFSYKNNNSQHLGLKTNESHKRINPTNPFFASKEKLSFNSLNSNLMKNSLQSQNQYFLNDKENTIIYKNKSESPISLNNNDNKNPTIINISLSKQQNNINNSQNQMKIKDNNTFFINKKEIIEEIKPNLNLEVINKEKISSAIHQIDEKKEIPNNFIESNNIISSIDKHEQSSLTNFNDFNNKIITNNTITNRFEDNSNGIDMKNNEQNINIISNQNQKTNIINTSILNPNSIQQNSNNTNINIESKNERINMNNMSLNNNYDRDSNNNVIFSTLNKDDSKDKIISIESKRSKGKEIKIKLSPFKKKELSIENEKNIHSSFDSQNININNIQKLNCNTFAQSENNNLIGNDSIIYQKEISTSVDEISFLKKFDFFLSKNNISIQNFIPMAFNENGQQYLKQNAFWEKYINYIYINYSMNNIKLSLFSFVHIIEQYFLWCENLTSKIVEEFITLIIDIINKIYNRDEIKQFCSMNKINNFEELFEKYKIFISNKNGSSKYDKEVEIKISNEMKNECNCELCKSELACMKKLIELNKNKIIKVNIENLFYNGIDNKMEYKKKDDEKEMEYKKTKKTYPPKKSRDSSAKKKVSEKLNESKKKKSSGEKNEYFVEEKEKSKNKKRNSSMSKNKRESLKKKEKQFEEDIKIDSYFKKDITGEEKKSDLEEEISDKDNRKKIKNKKKEKGKKNKSYKEEKKDSNDQSEEEGEEEETKNKKNKKKQKSKSKIKKKDKKHIDNESDNDENNKVKVNRKKRKYPKD